MNFPPNPYSLDTNIIKHKWKTILNKKLNNVLNKYNRDPYLQSSGRGRLLQSRTKD